ncbi:UbiA family prenyltransferase [Rubritalea spongiae]|uniref:UbiA family prenyltransferase n=1 Tax=Rubritalea spongiae TaxID=430797 RepID=A0ABW5E7W4_9BACT
MPQQSKLSAILATGRISNLPTVWCNVLVAFLLIQLAILYFHDLTDTTLSLPLFITTCIAASFLYVGGCLLGDAVDVEFDLAHKPDRPIPMGILTRKSVYTWASTLLSIGISLPSAFLYFSTSEFHLYPLITTLILAGAIVAYSLWHKRSPWIGLPLIGACRLFLILFAASVAAAPVSYCALTLPTAIFAIAVGLFTVCFASVARSESSPSPITWRKLLIAVMLLLPFTTKISEVVIYDQLSFTAPEGTAIILYWIWMVTAFGKINTNKGQFVSMSLAGFCLLDACFASFFGWQWLLVCLILFIFSLTLQKWAPAT